VSGSRDGSSFPGFRFGLGRPPGAVPSRDEYFTAWSASHGGYDPRGSRLVAAWLTLTYHAARPLASVGVPPDLVTWVGATTSAVVVALAAVGGQWVVVAAGLVVLSGLLDNVDGAVAVLTGRATRWGYVLDSVVDRVCEALYLLALWVLGGAASLCVAAGALATLQEYARARAGAAGMSEVGVVTVWERPTRVIVTALFLFVVGRSDEDAAAFWAGAGALAWLTLGLVGCAQLGLALRRLLR
jgi:phosphatidylglycerophosphate synthase